MHFPKTVNLTWIIPAVSPLFTIFFSFLINRSLETFTIRVILGAVSVVAGTVILFGF
jgi:hypothetical protein